MVATGGTRGIGRHGIVVVLCLWLAGCSAYHGPIDNRPDPDAATPSRWGSSQPVQHEAPAPA